MAGLQGGIGQEFTYAIIPSIMLDVSPSRNVDFH